MKFSLYAVGMLLAVVTQAANHYVRDGSSGDGSDWANAWDDLPAVLTRGDTYYVADGNYAAYAFNDAVSGELYITVKKATGTDHGTDTGWQASYGDGQAVFTNYISIERSYFVWDGNGTHTVPSGNSADYGFKIASACTNCLSGILRIGYSGDVVSNITVKYTHVYESMSNDMNIGTVSVRFWPANENHHIKLQNNYLQNSGKDGIQISRSDFILIERNYCEKLGMLPGLDPDYHGQTVQMFWSVHDVVFRWNYWVNCEGQSLVAYGDDGETTSNIRFYGNVVWSPYAHEYPNAHTEGFNLSGGLIGDPWAAVAVSNLFIYNNTIVNQRRSYTQQDYPFATYTTFPIAVGIVVSNVFAYNNLFYNSESSSAPRFNGTGFHASGGYGTAGGTGEQTGLTAGIFQNYTGDDFRLAAATDPGKNLAIETWWSDGADSFFVSLDTTQDVYGGVRNSDGTWDRGAFEYEAEAPTAPTANFSGTPLTGLAPLTVTFTDLTTGTPTSWGWDFGDGTYAYVQNPSHEFAVGTNTITLYATNAQGYSSYTRNAYIAATNAPAAPPVVGSGNGHANTLRVTGQLILR